MYLHLLYRKGGGEKEEEETGSNSNATPADGNKRLHEVRFNPHSLFHHIETTTRRYKMDEFAACCTGGERVLLAYHNIPEESTTIDR